jgi:hypothetical protein
VGPDGRTGRREDGKTGRREDENVGAKVGGKAVDDDEGEVRRGYGMFLVVEGFEDTGRRMERRVDKT